MYVFFDRLALLLYVCIMYVGMYHGGSINWLIVSSDQDHIMVFLKATLDILGWIKSNAKIAMR